MASRYVLWACVMVAGVLAAAASGQNVALHAGRSDEPMSVKADKLVSRAVGGVWETIFRGNVTVEQGDLKMNCDALRLDYREDKDAKRKKSGSAGLPEHLPEATNLRTVTASGHVAVEQRDIVGEAEEAVYDHARRTITLTERPRVRQAGNLIKAEKIIIFLDEKRTELVGKKDSRIEVTVVSVRSRRAMGELPLSASAQDVAPKTGLPKDKPITIKADSATGRGIAGGWETTFRENVVVEQNDLTMTCETLRAEYHDDKTAKSKKNGSIKVPKDLAGANSLKSIAATGQVTIKQQDIKAKAAEALYDHGQRTITLTGRPRVEQAENVITAEKIVMHIDRQSTDLVGRRGNPIEVTFVRLPQAMTGSDPDAATAASNDAGKRGDLADIPIIVKAEKGIGRTVNGRWETTLQGNVVAKHGDFTLTCGTLSAQGLYPKSTKSKESIPDKGGKDPAKANDGKAVAAPGRTMLKLAGKAKAEKALYDDAKRTITLTGLPRVEQGKNLLEAEKIVIHMDENRLESVGQKDSPITIKIIDPRGLLQEGESSSQAEKN